MLLADCDVDQLPLVQKQQLLCALHQRLLHLVNKAVQHQPSLAPLITYQQQPKQGWIALGVPSAARTVTAAGGAAVSGSASAGAAATGALGGFDSDASDFK